MTRVAIALGGNLAQPLATLKQASERLQREPTLTEVQVSSFYSSSPMGPTDQPDYVNAVAIAETILEPLALLDLLQAIEQEFGRQRIRRWGERSLDLDLILYGQTQLQHERLTIPHIGLPERDFVVIPLLEIWPDACLPDQTPVRDFLASMQHHDLVKVY